MNEVEERLEALESRIAFQDRIIEDLSAALAEQWKVIDLLKRKTALLEEQARAASAAMADARSEPPPPHY